MAGGFKAQTRNNPGAGFEKAIAMLGQCPVKNEQLQPGQKRRKSSAKGPRKERLIPALPERTRGDNH